MELHFAPETEAKLSELAAQRSREPQSLVHEAVECFIDYERWFDHEVDKGLAQLNTGEILEHEEVGKRLEELISRKQHCK